MKAVNLTRTLRETQMNLTQETQQLLNKQLKTGFATLILTTVTGKLNMDTELKLCICFCHKTAALQFPLHTLDIYSYFKKSRGTR